MIPAGEAIFNGVCKAPCLDKALADLWDEDLCVLLEWLQETDAGEVKDEVWAAAKDQAGDRFMKIVKKKE